MEKMDRELVETNPLGFLPWKKTITSKRWHFFCGLSKIDHAENEPLTIQWLLLELRSYGCIQILYISSHGATIRVYHMTVNLTGDISH